MATRSDIARALATAFLAGPLEVDGAIARGAKLLGERRAWLRHLAARLCAEHADCLRPRRTAVENFILQDAGFDRACQKHAPRIVRRLALSAEMAPVAAAQEWSVPSIPTSGALARWLGVGVGDLAWFADLQNRAATSAGTRLAHYFHQPLVKRDGRIRMLEVPKQNVKEIQRRLLAEIIDRIPPHAAVHGFRLGHSIRTFAAPHVGRRVVLRMDLADFFPAVSLGRIQSLFRTAGYPERVAQMLAGVCTCVTPVEVWQRPALDHLPRAARLHYERLYSRRHLPQGAPTSPALANLAAFRLDCRLAALAEAAGATYTRYADDLAFSGDDDFARGVHRFRLHVAAITIDEGFAVNFRKTRIMRHAVRQRLAGIVVNAHPNILRADYDRLKAILTNCVRHGPASQNREGHQDFAAHLLGRVAFVEMVNPQRGERLRELFRRITW